MMPELKSLRDGISIVCLSSALSLVGCGKTQDSPAVSSRLPDPAAESSDPTQLDGALPKLPADSQQQDQPLSGEPLIETIRNVVDAELRENPAMLAYVTHQPACVEATRLWLKVGALKDLGAEGATGSSDRIRVHMGVGYFKAHRFVRFPDDLIFDSTFRQYLKVGDGYPEPEGLPSYFLGDLNELMQLFKTHKDILYPHVKLNILRIEAADEITDEHIEAFVRDVWEKTRK